MGTARCSMFRAARGANRFAVGRRLLSVIAQGLFGEDGERGTWRMLRSHLHDYAMGEVHQTLLKLAEAVETAGRVGNLMRLRQLGTSAVMPASNVRSWRGAVRGGLSLHERGQLDQIRSISPGAASSSRTAIPETANLW